MGACGSKGKEDSFQEKGNWNASYQEIADELASKHRKALDKAGDANLGIEKSTGNKLSSVNGYAVGKVLGKGAYGEVFLASKAGEKFALKVLKKSSLKQAAGFGRRCGAAATGVDTIQKEIARWLYQQQESEVGNT